MAIFFTLFYRYPEWADDSKQESKYLEGLVELADKIQKGAIKDFGCDVFYRVVCLNPAESISFVSSNTPNLMVIADVSEGEDSFEDMVGYFQKTCLVYMKNWAKNGETVFSWWRLFQDTPLISV